MMMSSTTAPCKFNVHYANKPSAPVGLVPFPTALGTILQPTTFRQDLRRHRTTNTTSSMGRGLYHAAPLSSQREQQLAVAGYKKEIKSKLHAAAVGNATFEFTTGEAVTMSSTSCPSPAVSRGGGGASTTPTAPEPPTNNTSSRIWNGQWNMGVHSFKWRLKAIICDALSYQQKLLTSTTGSKSKVQKKKQKLGQGGVPVSLQHGLIDISPQLVTLICGDIDAFFEPEPLALTGSPQNAYDQIKRQLLSLAMYRSRGCPPHPEPSVSCTPASTESSSASFTPASTEPSVSCCLSDSWRSDPGEEEENRGGGGCTPELHSPLAEGFDNGEEGVVVSPPQKETHLCGTLRPTRSVVV